MSAPREVVVRGTASGFAQIVEVEGLHLVADEPAEFGGSGTGPTPYDLLLAALGTCTSMTVGLYARKHEIPLDGVTVRLSHARVHETDCEECPDHTRRLDRISLTLELAGTLNDEQRQRLRQIAARCPVHKTLTSNIEIEIR
ncbi:MAG TPA: OsmC family protein [Polyangia bacterium]|jgi:putative redox protein